MKLQARASREIISIAWLTGILTLAFGVTVVASNNIIAAVYGSTPIIDGLVEDSEWDDASTVTIVVANGANCTVYAKQDGANLYVGFNITDVIHNASDCCVIIFDVNHDKNVSLQTDDLWLAISREGNQSEKNVTFGGWYPTSVSGWTAKASSSAKGWQSEYNITYSKLDVTAGTNKTLGIEFLIVDHDVEKGWYTWPSPWISNPATWGYMTSNGYNWIPEFSTLTSILLILTVLTAAIIFCKRRSLRTSCART